MVTVETERLTFYYVLAMNKDILPIQYIAALEEKYAEQVAVNQQLLETVKEQMAEITRLENQVLALRMGRTDVDDWMPLIGSGGQA